MRTKTLCAFAVLLFAIPMLATELATPRADLLPIPSFSMATSIT